MTGKQKLYFLLNRIDDARTIAPSGQTLSIDPLEDLNQNLTNRELAQLFTKLDKDEKVIKLIKAPKTVRNEYSDLDPYDYAEDGYWYIELKPTFERYFSEIQHEQGYQEFTGKKPPTQTQMKLNKKSLEKIWNVLQEIETIRGIGSNGDEISIPHVHLSKVKNPEDINTAIDERIKILRKLENEEAIKDIRRADDYHKHLTLKTDSKYFDRYNYYQEEYKKLAMEYQEENKPSHNTLSLLHPDIFTKCQSLYEKKEYAEAVAKGFRVVKDRLRVLTKQEKGSEAFGKGHLHINGASAENVDRDFNQGVMFLTMAIDMFRNEKSHTSDGKIEDPQRAYEYLTLSSLAMNLLDQAEIKEPS